MSVSLIDLAYDKPYHVIGAALVLLGGVYFRTSSVKGQNPFHKDTRRLPSEKQHDKGKRDAVLKDGYTKKKLAAAEGDRGYDVIVIGRFVELRSRDPGWSRFYLSERIV